MAVGQSERGRFPSFSKGSPQVAGLVGGAVSLAGTLPKKRFAGWRLGYAACPRSLDACGAQAGCAHPVDRTPITFLRKEPCRRGSFFFVRFSEN